MSDNLLLLKTEEAGERLNVGRTTIYALISSGDLASVKIGRSRRIIASSLESYVSGLAGSSVGATAA
jgi:excisionase family DNA binding protein